LFDFCFARAPVHFAFHAGGNINSVSDEEIRSRIAKFSAYIDDRDPYNNGYSLDDFVNVFQQFWKEHIPPETPIPTPFTAGLPLKMQERENNFGSQGNSAR
jgi:hypothetical protein